MYIMLNRSKHPFLRIWNDTGGLFHKGRGSNKYSGRSLSARTSNVWGVLVMCCVYLRTHVVGVVWVVGCKYLW